MLDEWHRECQRKRSLPSARFTIVADLTGDCGATRGLPLPARQRLQRCDTIQRQRPVRATRGASGPAEPAGCRMRSLEQNVRVCPARRADRVTRHTRAPSLTDAQNPGTDGTITPSRTNRLGLRNSASTPAAVNAHRLLRVGRRGTVGSCGLCVDSCIRQVGVGSTRGVTGSRRRSSGRPCADSRERVGGATIGDGGRSGRRSRRA